MVGNVKYSMESDKLQGHLRTLISGKDESFIQNKCVSEVLDYFVPLLHELRTKTSDDDTVGGCTLTVVVCSFCTDLLSDPVTLLCGHTYCKKCLQRRDEEAYIELCVKCDETSLKRTRWCFFKRSLLERYRVNVVLQAVIKTAYSDEHSANTARVKGNEYFAAHNLDDAVAKYKEAVNICPHSLKSWSNLSRVKSCQNLYDEALFAAQKSLQICESWSKGYYHEGIAYEGLNNKLESAFSFLKYLIIEPTSFTVKQKLVETLTEVLSVDVSQENDENENCSVENVVKNLLEKAYEFCSSKTHRNTAFEVLEEKMNSNITLEVLQSRLTCPLCCRVFFKATSTPCGHTFCTSCLERSLDYRHTCSICRSSLTELITINPKPVDVAIDRLTQKYFPKEYEESRSACVSESTIVNYETDDVATISIFVCMPTFPTLECPLHVFEPRYKLMLRRSLESPEKTFGMCMYDEHNKFKDYGTMLEVGEFRLLDDGRMLVNTVGRKRFRVLERGTRDGYATAKVQFLNDVACPVTENLKTLHQSVYDESETLLNSLPLIMRHSVQSNYGDIPEITQAEDLELTNGQGPKWVWHMLRLLFHADDDIEAALKCNNLNERLLMIRDGLSRIREFYVRNDILSD